MIDAAVIAFLLPHAGAMVLLDRVEHWGLHAIVCRAGSHLRQNNPLRRDGRLASVHGIEYGMQAAALHGALVAGGQRQQIGFLANLRGIVLHVERLDDPGLGPLGIEARLERREVGGLIYGFDVRADGGRPLVSGRATISLRRSV